jgi:hypothetical protein
LRRRTSAFRASPVKLSVYQNFSARAGRRAADLLSVIAARHRLASAAVWPLRVAARLRYLRTGREAGSSRLRKTAKDRLLTRAAQNRAHLFAVTYRAATARERSGGPIFPQPASLGLQMFEYPYLLGFEW